MNELDNLKKIWKDGTPELRREFHDKPGHDGLIDQLNRQQKSIFRSNLLATACVALTSVYLISLMFIYPEEHRLFYISISSVIALMLLTLLMLWHRQMKVANDLSFDSKTFIDHQLKRMRRTRFIIEYSPLYGLMLGILISLYGYSLLHDASAEFVFWMININWIYISVISFFAYRFKMRKYRKQMAPLVHDLEKLKRSMMD